VLKFLIVLLAILTCHELLSGQTVLLVAKGGSSSNGTVGWGSVGGGGGGDGSWDSGPMFGLGARVRRNERIAFEGMLEYSSHARIRREHDAPLVNAPRLTRFDLIAMARWSWGLFRPMYFILLLGPVLTYQKVDDVVVRYDSSQYTTPGTRGIHLGLLLGIGFEGRVADRWEISVEGGLKMRSYIAATAQLGVAYVL
jgi:hypothetical protein